MGLFTISWSLVTIVFLLIGQTQAAITGQQYCNKYVCITGRHDSDKNVETYTLAPPLGMPIPQKTFGWMAIGFGTTMTNTPMVIVWPNSDGSITLSQRQASGHIMPKVLSDPPRKAALLTASSFTNTTSTSITFTMPSSTNVSASLNQTALIWAYSTVNPGSSAINANIQQHLASGNARLALLAPLPAVLSTPNTTGEGNSTGTRPGTVTGSGNGTIIDNDSSTTVNRKMLIAHVACGAVATMAILPIGILVPRIARGLSMNRWWFPVHGALNGVIAFGLIVAAFAIARSNFTGGFNSTHRKLGLTLFILAIFQTVLGVFIHAYQRSHRFQTSGGRGPTNFLHMVLGLVVVGVGFGAIYAGIDEEWGRYSGTGNPNVGWKVGWGLIVAITALAYIGGLYFVPRQLQNEARRRQWASSVGHGSNNANVLHTNTSRENSTPMKQTPMGYTAPPPPPVHAHTRSTSRGSSGKVHRQSSGRSGRSIPPVAAAGASHTTGIGTGTGAASVIAHAPAPVPVTTNTSTPAPAHAKPAGQYPPPKKRRLPPPLSPK